jgi:hypothetical protein
MIISNSSARVALQPTLASSSISQSSSLLSTTSEPADSRRLLGIMFEISSGRLHTTTSDGIPTTVLEELLRDRDGAEGHRAVLGRPPERLTAPANLSVLICRCCCSTQNPAASPVLSLTMRTHPGCRRTVFCSISWKPPSFAGISSVLFL